MKQILLMLGVLIIASCSGSQLPEQMQLDSMHIALHGCPEPTGKPKDVGIPELVASPAAFDAVLVRVSGHYHDDFEHHAIYPGSKPEPDDHRFSDGIWLLRLDPDFRGDRIQVTGYFTARTKGHLDQWLGSICVTSVARAPQHAP